MFEAELPTPLILRYYGSILAAFSEFLLPASLLLATLYTLWQMSRNNELTAMRASGISLYRLMWPFLLVGCITTFLMAVLKETVTPGASHWADELKEMKFVIDDEPPPIPLNYVNTDTFQEWRIEEFRPQHPEHLEGVQIKWDRHGDITIAEREIFVALERDRRQAEEVMAKVG